ncbi:hypothetical protein ACQ86N_05815 [Puia sp. P3]|uniref:hypothetical protein n=1 Tax=Puia sp. P3 TaxID=3423952 RepID=UPI003D669A3C
MSEQQKKRTRMTVHICFALVFLICILIFKWVNNKSIVNTILDLAGYTYGPLLGLFAFGIFTKRVLENTWKITALCSAGAGGLLFYQPLFGCMVQWVSDRDRVVAGEWDIDVFGVVGSFAAAGRSG